MPTDKAELLLQIERINKRYGSNAVHKLSQTRSIPRIPTEIPQLDAIIGGGLPQGRLIELYGAEGSGKTSLAYWCCSRVDKAYFLDAEGTFDRQQAEVYGNTDSNLMVQQPDTAEEAFDSMRGMAKAGVPIIVLDSIAAMIPTKQLEEDDPEKRRQMGIVAALLSEKLPIIALEARKSGSVVLMVNQLRQNIGISWGDPDTTPGGKAPKHWSSLRIQVARKQTIVKKGKPSGIITKVRIKKSKVCDPFGTCEMTLMFGRGWQV